MERFYESTNILMLIKQGSLSPLTKYFAWFFMKYNKGKPARLVLYCFPLYRLGQSCLLKSFLWSLTLMTWNSLTFFPSGSNLKLYNIPRWLRRPSLFLITDSILVVDLKNCQLKLFYTSKLIFSMYLSSSHSF